MNTHLPVTCLRSLLAIAASVLVTSCGGGEDNRVPAAAIQSPPHAPSAPAEQIKKASGTLPRDFPLVLSYFPEPQPSYPYGRIVVSPPDGVPAIFNGELALVELRLFGEPAQRLTEPNAFSDGQVAQQSYVFKAPESLRPGAYACVPGTHPSELDVMDTATHGVTMLFELCPGTAFQRIETSRFVP